VRSLYPYYPYTPTPRCDPYLNWGDRGLVPPLPLFKGKSGVVLEAFYVVHPRYHEDLRFFGAESFFGREKCIAFRDRDTKEFIGFLHYEYEAPILDINWIRNETRRLVDDKLQRDPKFKDTIVRATLQLASVLRPDVYIRFEVHNRRYRSEFRFRPRPVHSATPHPLNYLGVYARDVTYHAFCSKLPLLCLCARHATGDEAPGARAVNRGFSTDVLRHVVQFWCPGEARLPPQQCFCLECVLLNE